MGVFVTGESPELSWRVKRKLPQSLLGRAFPPGSTRGPALAISSPWPTAQAMFALTVAGGAVLAHFNLAHAPKGNKPLWTLEEVSRIAWFAVVALAYLALYLGAGLLVLRWLRRFVQPGLLLTGIVHFLLFVLGVVAPFVIELIRSQGVGDYSFLQITNAFWTLRELDRYLVASDRAAIAAAVSALAIMVFLANLRGVAHKLRQVRIQGHRRHASARDKPQQPR